MFGFYFQRQKHFSLKRFIDDFFNFWMHFKRSWNYKNFCKTWLWVRYHLVFEQLLNQRFLRVTCFPKVQLDQPLLPRCRQILRCKAETWWKETCDRKGEHRGVQEEFRSRLQCCAWGWSDGHQMSAPRREDWEEWTGQFVFQVNRAWKWHCYCL